MSKGKPIRRVIFNVYPLDDWLLKALAGQPRKGRYAGEAREIRRALRVYAGLLEIRPPAELLASDQKAMK